MTGTNTFTTAATSSSGGDSGGGGGGGGGGGTGGKTITTSASSPETPVSETPAASAAADSAQTAGSEKPAPTAVQPTEVSQTVKLNKGNNNLISVSDKSFSLKQLSIDSKTDKETVFTFKTFPSKPDNTPELHNAYQYFDITVDLTPDEIRRAIVTFSVPKSWLTDNNYLEKSVRLNTLENGQWQELSTKMTAQGENELVYEAKLTHFSAFAINGKSELESSWFKDLIPPKFGTKEFVLFSFIVLIAVLILIYLLLREPED